MALITIQSASSYSPKNKASNNRRRRRPNSTSGGPWYPVCLSFRFLCLSSLVTCWVGFFHSYFDSNSLGGYANGSGKYDDYITGGDDGCAGNSISATGVSGLREVSLVDSMDTPARNDARNERTGTTQRQGTASPSFIATSVADDNETEERNDSSNENASDEDSDNDDEYDEEEEDIDLDTMLFVENRILIAPGELPGYTGWARPENTLTGHYQITGVSEMKGKTHEEWFIDLECTAEQCSRGGSLFYLRAYGPAIITGKMVDNEDGTYRAIFYPTDPGRYTVEVVLEFSEKPELTMFPVGANDTELAYEGWLLPGFPMQITFEDAEDSDDDNSKALVKSGAGADGRTWCSFDQLLETDTDSGRTRGRWKVVDNVRTKYHRQITPDGNGVSYLGYQHGLNSIGVKLKYDNNDCKVLTYARANRDADSVHLVDRCLSSLGIANSPKPEDQVHVVFVGCSVMRLMHSSFNFLLRKANVTNVKTSLVDIRRGLFRTLPHMKTQLRNFTKTNPDEKRYVVFNTGLHDIDRLCSGRMWAARLRDQDLMNKTIPEGQPCVETYRQQFEKMVRFIGEYPAELKIFRSTTPGWMKYGNFGFSWPTEFVQPFQRSHHMVTHINDIAFDVLANSDNANDIHIMDGFWTSLARPDNTEMGPRNQIGKHMVHPGVEVMDAMARKWMHLIVRSMCSNALDD